MRFFYDFTDQGRVFLPLLPDRVADSVWSDNTGASAPQRPTHRLGLPQGTVPPVSPYIWTDSSRGNRWYTIYSLYVLALIKTFFVSSVILLLFIHYYSIYQYF